MAVGEADESEPAMTSDDISSSPVLAVGQGPVVVMDRRVAGPRAADRRDRAAGRRGPVFADGDEFLAALREAAAADRAGESTS